MLEELGVVVTGRIPCIVESQELNVGYLATKQVLGSLIAPGRQSCREHASGVVT